MVDGETGDSMTLALCLSALAGGAARRFGWPVAPVSVAAGSVAIHPILPLLVAAGYGLIRSVKRVRTSRDEAAATAGDVVLLADLVALGLSAGLSLRSALERSAPRLGPGIGSEIQGVLRSADRSGLAASLAVADGATGRLLGLAARASTTGAPLAPAVAAYSAEERHAAHARAAEAARKLPVRLLVPLALLVLPGFMVLVLGPVIVDSLARIGPLP